jgi:hypothetical protein
MNDLPNRQTQISDHTNVQPLFRTAVLEPISSLPRNLLVHEMIY